MYRRTIDEFGVLANRCSSTTDPFFCHDAQVDPSFSSYIDDHFSRGAEAKFFLLVDK